jgi:hypothetical protein
MYPHMGYPPNPRDWIEAMKDWEEWEEEKDRKRKDKDKSKYKDKKGFTTFEIFLILMLSSPVVGPLYLFAVIAGAKHVAEMLQALH